MSYSAILSSDLQTRPNAGRCNLLLLYLNFCPPSKYDNRIPVSVARASFYQLYSTRENSQMEVREVHEIWTYCLYADNLTRQAS
jgi:hypothetical protein